MKGRESTVPYLESTADDALLSGLDHLDQGVLFIGPDLCVRVASKVLHSIYGFPDDIMVVGQHMSEVFRFLAERGDYGPGDPEAIVEDLLDSIRKGRRSQVDTRLGNGKTVEIRRTPLPDGGMIAVTTDMTDRQNAAEALRQSEQRFRDIAEIASDWFWETDADMRFSYFSDRNRELLGFDMSTIIGKKRTDITPENVDDAKWQAHLAQLAAHQPFKDFRYDIRTPDGSVFHVSISGKPVFDYDGIFTGYRGVGRDLTRDTESEAALRKSVSVLQATLDATADGIVVVELNTRAIQAYNRRFVEIFDVPEDLMAARDGWKLRSWVGELAVDTEAYYSDVDMLFAQPDREARNTMVLRDGRIIDRFSRPQFLDDDIVGRVISFRDVTEQRRTAAELQSQKTLLELVFRDVPDTMVLADADRRVRMCNPAFSRSFGYGTDEVIGRTADFLYEDQETYERDGCSRIAAAGDAVQAPYIVNYRRKDGEVFPGETVGSTLRAPNGDILGFIAVIRDVGSRLKAEQERLDALEMAEEANRAKSAFLANVSHDLRTPLNAVLGFAEIIKQELLGPVGHEKYLEYAEDIRESGAYLLDLVNDLLDISTIEAGQRQVRPEPIDINQFIPECVKAATVRAAGGAEVTTDLGDNPPALHADRRAMKQVILNLLANSLKFTPAQGRIVIRVHYTGDQFEIAVEDTGKGIPKENLNKIARAFERGQSNAYATADGTGLGLAIARSLVELHGGTFTIESEVGQGTTVTFTLPDTMPSSS